MFKMKRVYEKADESDGLRILVDRLWPRGLRKEDAKVDLWLKDVAPSTELRNLIHGGEVQWEEFKEKYFEELKGKESIIKEMRLRAKAQTVTLLYAAKDVERNNAKALLEFLRPV